MPRGGSRPGTGRKPNTPNKATVERQAKVEASGVTPLDVMLRAMRFNFELAETILTSERPDSAGVAAALKAAADVAKDAAPYVHPRLANVTVKAQDKSFGTANKFNLDMEEIAKFMQMAPLERARRVLFAIELSARQHENNQANKAGGDIPVRPIDNTPQ